MSQQDSRSTGAPPRTWRAGQTIEDVCRACRADRMHTVMVVDGNGRPIRVVCGFCGSEHNYRGGGRTASSRSSSRDGQPSSSSASPSSSSSSSAPVSSSSWSTTGPAVVRPSLASTLSPLDFVSERERIAPPVVLDAPDSLPDESMDLELLLRRVIREESGLTPVTPAERWRGGDLVLRPGKAGVQEKTWPIETFFHKIVMLRNRLRTLEQQVNASELPDDAKVKLQSYITGCYGSLTSFNILFADEDDQFKGAGGE